MVTVKRVGVRCKIPDPPTFPSLISLTGFCWRKAKCFQDSRYTWRDSDAYKINEMIFFFFFFSFSYFSSIILLPQLIVCVFPCISHEVFSYWKVHMGSLTECIPGSRNSMLVRASDSWSKGWKFESQQKRWDNFLLQSQLCALTLIRCLFHPCVTAVA